MEYSLSTMLDNIRMVRNELSHRSTIKAHFDIEAYQTELRGFGIPLYANGFVNTKILEKDHVVKIYSIQELPRRSNTKNISSCYGIYLSLLNLL